MSDMDPPWSTTFHLTVSPLEIIVRGSIIYLVLFFVLVKFRRPAGGLGVGDLLLLVLIADAAQNAMSADYKSVPDGLILIGTLLFWNLFIDWLAVRWKWLDAKLHPKPLPLARDGEMIEENMRRRWVTPAELEGRIREHGMEEVGDVKVAYMEGDGKISIIGFDPSDGENGDEDDDRPGA
ncbi:MAG TPA: YetF domain-containing protein [Thermoanaerobaculia bacterium]|nr:YetF domain-containing protein [Thermoanaerobaculia bacterium]